MDMGRGWLDASGRAVNVDDFVHELGGVWIAAWCTPKTCGWVSPAKVVRRGDPDKIVRATVGAVFGDPRVRTYQQRGEAVRYLACALGWRKSRLPCKSSWRIVELYREGVTNESELARRVGKSLSFVISVLDLPDRLFRRAA